MGLLGPRIGRLLKARGPGPFRRWGPPGWPCMWRRWGSGADECLKHSYYTRISLAFSYCFGIIYIVLVLDLIFSVYFGIQA